jgi:hypothetical protein
MASALKDLTRMGSDVRKLAKLLQAKAPEGHMLAYINPREAALLKAHGGSGKPHADTGIPSFEDGDPSDYEASQMTDTSTPSDASVGENYITPVTFGETPSAAPAQDTTFAGFPGIDRSFESPIVERGPGASLAGADLAAAQKQLEAPGATQPAQPGLVKQLAEKTGLKEDTLARLGIAGIQGLLGSRAASAAAREGQQGKAEIQALATPYQQKGSQLQAQAQRGELTPQAMQSLQAAQAQAAQGVSARGGVGVAQATAQIEALRQQLLQQQYDYGLKLSGIGDNIALGAIKTGLEADRYVQQINNQFYSNMAYIAAGMTPGSTGGGR